jgi:signal transduction histidine kinase
MSRQHLCLFDGHAALDHEVDDALTFNVHSSGYGLFTAQKTVEVHGGKMWFASAGVPGKGTTFFVELPVHTPLAAHAHATTG